MIEKKNLTSNTRLRALMIEYGLDIRPDPRVNQDARYIAQLLNVSPRTIISWLSPNRWRSSRPMPTGYLELLELKLKKRH